ncbi:MAG: type I restriction-modification system subunit M N-terminal domain-containing protein [Candidatus Rokubacteria bacterium]|nr:type I restriction-modification system subunit M N-terminal domain-containing protein [Candidatus Rokubacteria bacterium]
MNHGEIVSFIWGVADLIRDTFKRGKYQDVILPLTVLRRLDCVLAPMKEKVLTTLAKYKGKGLENPDPLLRKSSGFAFYNTSRYDFAKLLADAPNVADGQVGRVGYEINFNRYFYKYQPPRPLPEIEADIKALEKEILEMLGKITKETKP